MRGRTWAGVGLWLIALISNFTATCVAAPASSPLSLAVAAVEKQLGSGENGQGWRRFLGLDQLQSAMSGGKPLDPLLVGHVLRRLSSGEPGLDTPEFSALRRALETDLNQQAELADQLPALVRGAREQFSPVTGTELSRARRRLSAAVARLDRFLASSERGGAWRRFLGWQELSAESAAGGSESPSAAGPLAELRRRFTSGYRGLELPEFAHVERALDQLMRQARLAGDAKAPERYVTLVDALAQRIERWQTRRDEARAELRDIGRVLGWLEDHGQAVDLVPVVRARLSHPNLYALVSSDVVRHAVQRDVSRTTRIADCILGTSIRGVGQTQGTVQVVLAPDPRRATFDAIFTGTTRTNTSGVNGPALIRARGQTQIQATKRMRFDVTGMTTLPTVAHARTRTQITGIGSTAPGLRGRLVTRIARKRAAKSKGQAEAIGSRKAERQFSSQFDSEAVALLDKANDTYFTRLRRPLFERQQFPERLEFTTTSQRVRVLALQANHNQLAAQTPPPPLTGQPTLAVQIHESAINNTTFGLFAGETLTQERMEELAVELLGRVPEELKTESDQEPWSITFDALEPVVVRFDETGLEITVKGTRYTSGDGRYGAMNVTGRYQFAEAPSGWVLRRNEELEILPPGFVPGEQRLGLRQTILRNLLKRRFGKLFQPEIQIDGFVLPEALRNAGTFYHTQHHLGGGWLVLGWRNDPTKLPAEPAVAVASIVPRWQLEVRESSAAPPRDAPAP